MWLVYSYLGVLAASLVLGWLASRLGDRAHRALFWMVCLVAVLATLYCLLLLTSVSTGFGVLMVAQPTVLVLLLPALVALVGVWMSRRLPVGWTLALAGVAAVAAGLAWSVDARDRTARDAYQARLDAGGIRYDFGDYTIVQRPELHDGVDSDGEPGGRALPSASGIFLRDTDDFEDGEFRLAGSDTYRTLPPGFTDRPEGVPPPGVTTLLCAPPREDGTRSCGLVAEPVPGVSATLRFRARQGEAAMAAAARADASMREVWGKTVSVSDP